MQATRPTHLSTLLTLIPVFWMSACGGEEQAPTAGQPKAPGGHADVSCALRPHANAAIQDGQCVYTCDEGFLNKGNPAAPDCQGCAQRPHASGVLQDGQCVYTCEPGFTNLATAAAPKCSQAAICADILHIHTPDADTGVLGDAEPCPTETPYCVQPDRDAAGRCVAKDDLVYKMTIRVTEKDRLDRRMDLNFKVTDAFSPSGAKSDYDVDCNDDGTWDREDQGAGVQTCTYSETGKYTIALRGYMAQLELVELSNEKLIAVPQWGLNPWATLAHMFHYSRFLSEMDPKAPNLQQVTSLQSTFAGAVAFNVDIGHWDTQDITDMGSTFAASSFNQDIGGWNTSKVTNMGGMFRQAAFNQDISGWDTSKVTNMGSMFYHSPFNQKIGGWDTSKVTTMSGMFVHNRSFNQDISNWKTHNVTDMSDMFYGAAAFDQNISGWDTAKVTNMSGMFNGAAAFNQDLSGWDTAKVTNMSGMFNGAAAFNQDLSGWDTAKVTNMAHMFHDAAAFDQDLSGWKVGKVSDHEGAFQGCPITDAHKPKFNP